MSILVQENIIRAVRFDEFEAALCEMFTSTSLLLTKFSLFFSFSLALLVIRRECP